MARKAEDSDKSDAVAVPIQRPVGFQTAFETRDKLKYVIVPVESVRATAKKRHQDQVRVAQMSDDLIAELYKSAEGGLRMQNKENLARKKN